MSKINKTDLEKYKVVQKNAKKVMEEIEAIIVPGFTENDAVEECKKLLKKYSIQETWYHNCPALIYFGNRTCLSISGKKYKPDSSYKLTEDDIFTITLSPKIDDYWGALSRTFTISNHKRKNKGYSLLIDFQKKIHGHFLEFLTPYRAYDEIYEYFNKFIVKNGFQNADYNLSFGHSIEKDIFERKFFEKNNCNCISTTPFFAFETHIKKDNFNYSSKFENIYYFENDILKEL